MMTTTKELETVEIDGVKLDVHFNYNSDYGFDIQAIEDITGVQDLMPLLESWVIDAIEKELRRMYQVNGWL